MEDISTLSYVYGRGTATKVMAGKDCCKMVRYHSLPCVTFRMVKWEAFEQLLLYNDGTEALVFLSSLLGKFRTTYETKDTEGIVVVM